MRQNLQAALLVVLLQLPCVVAESNGWESPSKGTRRALKVSVGFPVPYASYTAVRTTGDWPPWANYPDRSEWLPGPRVARVFLALDALAGAAAFFGFRWLLRSEAGRAASAGFVLGVVAGVMDSLCGAPSWKPASAWIIALLAIGLPLVVCYLARGARSVWLPLLILTVALFVMPWMGRMQQFRADRGFSFTAKERTYWSPSVVEMVFAPVAGIVVLGIPVLLIWRFVPAFRKHESIA